MPFALAPLIAPLLGAGALGAIGEALIGIGLSFGMSYLARKLQPKPSTAATVAQGMQLSISYDPNGPRQFAFGRAVSAGTLVYHNVYGPNGNDYLQVVTKLADFPCDSMLSIRVDGRIGSLDDEVANANVTGTSITQFPNVLWAKFHDGAWSQAADADLISKSTGGEWTANFRGRGVCYTRFTAKYDAVKFKNGRPAFQTVFNGAKLYDWREDSTNGGSGAHRWANAATHEWSDNPAVILYNYMRGLYVNGAKVGGMNVPAANLPVDVWTAAANACDEGVARKGTTNEKRYTANGIWNLDGEHAAFIRDVLATMAGTMVDAGGDFKLYAGVARSPVLTLTDDDLMSQDAVTFSPRLSRAGLVNAVFGSFTDPQQAYQSVALPPRISPADQTADGGNQLSESYGLQYVISGTQGQRVLEIFRRRGRYQRSLSLKARASCVVLEAGDWITYNSTRYGFSGVLFEVIQATSARDLTTTLELREVSESIYAWNPAVDELDPDTPADVGSGGARLTTVQNVELTNVTLTGAGSQQRPGLRITWDAIDDATVINLALEFRKVGSVGAGERTILEPSAGSYEWVDGVQGGIVYEARLKPITLPVRGVTWTGWEPVPDNGAPQIVAIAEIAEEVPEDTITPDMLSKQARFELWLGSQLNDVLGSMPDRINRLQVEVDKAHLATINALLDANDARTLVRVETIERSEEDLALAQQITTLLAITDSNNAAIRDEQTARATADGSLAESIESISTTVGDVSAAVLVNASSINGIEARFTIATTANGEITGIVQLASDAEAGSQFVVVANSFKVAQPGVGGGATVPVFAISQVGGVPKLAFRGDMFADGTIAARHLNVATLSAIAANLGTVTAGVLRSPDNAYFFNLNTGILGTTDGAVKFDLKNRIFEMDF